MADISAIGSALVIDEKVLNRIKEADDRLVSLQKTADDTAKKIGASFKGMSDSVNPFLTSLDSIITKLGNISTAATNASGGLSQVKTNIGNINSGTTQTTQGIADLVNQLSQIGGKGASGVMQAVYAFQRLQESMKGSSGMNIAQLTEAINDIDKKLKDTENLLTKSEQDALVKRKALLQDELKEQQRTYEERVIAFQKAIDKMTSAQAAYNQKQQKNKVNTAAQATEKEIEQLEAKFRNMKAPDFGQTYEKIQQLKAELKSVKEEFSSTLAKIIEQDNFKAGKTNSAPALKKGEYQEMQHTIGVLGDKERSLQAEIDALTEKIKKENAAWREQRQALAENIEMLKNLKTYKSDSTSLDNQRSQNTLAEMRQYYKELEKTSQQALKADIKAVEEEEKLAERRKKAWEKANQSTNTYGQQYHNDRQKMYEQVFSSQNTTTSMALANSSSVKTLREHVAAIKELQQARLNLDTTDKNYKQNLEAVNNAIKQHSKALRDAGVNARSLGEQTSYLSGYISRLAQRTAVVFSMSAAKGFVEQIAEIRGQFELSERSLEAILQNKPKADEIFNKTVELAVKSPFRIKDLVDYTRQLSAYRIQSDKLYDTTKRLADVSAGLGVDMGRLILAYGQVKAAAYLRGSEVRQFTEAGINMYGELQSYFKEVKGEAYTTAQIVDMISKRKVTFEDVEAIFQRMTDKGGTFYNMQEIQAETLQGKISNLKDAFDVMLNDIGKENEGTFKGLISGATMLLNNWDKIAAVGKDLAGVLALIMLQANKTGVSLKEMWASTDFTTYSIKGKGVLGILANSFKTLGSAARSAGLLMKNALVSNLPLLAFASLAQLVWNAVSAYTSFREEQEKIISETIEAKKRLGELSAEYERIKDKYASKKDSTGNRIITNQTKFQKEAKSVLDSLNDELKAHKLEIPIEVKEPNAGDIDKAIQSSKTKLDKFIQMAQDAKSYINGEDNSFWNSGNLNLFGIPLWADSFSTDMKSLDDAANDVREFSSRAQTAIDALGEGYDKLSAKSKAAYDTIKDGAKPGELDVEYLQRVNKVMGQIFQNESKNKSFKEYADNLRKQLYGLDDNLGAVLSGSFKRAKNEAEHELQGLFDTINNIYGSYLKTLKPAEVKVFFDNVATQNNLNELQKKILLSIAANVYHFKVDTDQQSMNTTQQKIYSFMDDLQAEADRRKIKISLAVINPKNTLDVVKGFQSSAKDIKELIEQINRGKIQWFHGSNLGISSTMKWNNQNVDANTVFQKSTAIAFLRDQLKNVLAKNTLAGGTDPFAKENTKNANENAKNQRDILQERISLIKDMNSKYNELIKTETKEAALSKTRKYFKEAAQNVGWNANNILPDNESAAKQIENLGKQYKEISKKGNAFRVAADIKLNVSQKEYEKMKEDISRNIDETFSELDLYKKLKKEGLSDNIIKGIFGDITTSFDDLQSRIDDEFNKYITRAYEEKYGKDYSKWGQDVIDQYNKELANTSAYIGNYGEDVAKAYKDKSQKVNEKVKQDTIDTFSELTKAYKTQLSDQLQLDTWYIEERGKIQENENLAKNPQLKKQYQNNLDKQYKQKTDENTWKDFTGKDSYIELFQNVEQVSVVAVNNMLAQLERMKDALKNLPPDKLKAIVEQMDKLKEEKANRYPFLGIAESINEITKAQKNYSKAKEAYDKGFDEAQTKTNNAYKEYLELLKEAKETEEDDNASKEDKEAAKQRAIEAQEKYNKALEKSSSLQENYSGSSQKLSTAWLRLADRTKKIGTYISSCTKNISALSNALTGKASSSITKWGDAIEQTVGGLSDAVKAFKDLKISAKNNLGDVADKSSDLTSDVGQAATKTIDTIDKTVEGAAGAMVSTSATASAAIQTVEKASVILAIISAALQIATAIANLFNDESDIDEEIERQERLVNDLQHSYEKLKKSMDDAFKIDDLQKFNHQSIDALEKQKNAYNAMIKAEESRKNSDKSKIQEYKQKIEDLDDTIKELKETMTEELGGFGSEANYKAAAETFAEAWVDAFNEGSDTLDALNDKFDEYIQNLITKQATQRVVGRLLEPLLKEIDNAVSEGSEGGSNGLELTSTELEKIKKLGSQTTEQINKTLTDLANVLNFKGSGSTSLSSLQQGIQSVSEATAQALESILNSMRYYLAQQQADVRTIRDTLLERLGNTITSVTQDAASSPILVELRLHTGLLTDIRDTLDACVKTGHKQGRSGIKVFMN